MKGSPAVLESVYGCVVEASPSRPEIEFKDKEKR